MGELGKVCGEERGWEERGRGVGAWVVGKERGGEVPGVERGKGNKGRGGRGEQGEDREGDEKGSGGG